MKALGWDERYFPFDEDEPETRMWDYYLDQPKDFSLRHWNGIRPKLEELYHQKRRRIVCEDVIEHIKAAYLQYRKTQPIMARIGLPPWHELRLLAPSLINAIVAFQETAYTDQDIQGLMDRLKHETQGFLPSAQVELVKLMNLAKPSVDEPDCSLTPPGSEKYLTGAPVLQNFLVSFAHSGHSYLALVSRTPSLVALSLVSTRHFDPPLPRLSISPPSPF
ncbi:unnamed protein product [Cyclocybe aegerita]|uniref:Uncharacterized protein n=1 Tax=Cyclocybe aegerita TaxID=1973307 RepID=A0A8S0WJ70_CYCAE|nr:unnamed protein product [Cyclocybe aegerita]